MRALVAWLGLSHARDFRAWVSRPGPSITTIAPTGMVYPTTNSVNAKTRMQFYINRTQSAPVLVGQFTDD